MRIRNSINRESIPARVVLNVITFSVCLLAAQGAFGVKPSLHAEARHVKVYDEPGLFSCAKHAFSFRFI